MGFDFDLAEVLSAILHLLAAYVLALPIAWDREKRSRSAGLRTFPLVAVGACGYMLTGLHVLEGDAEAYSRIMYALIAGMGFIGGGAILKDRGRVHGTATAAALWNTGAIGMAVAWNRIDIAIVITAMGFLTFRYIARAKRGAHPEHEEDKTHPEDGPWWDD